MPRKLVPIWTRGSKENLDAALVEAKLDHSIKFTVKNGVVTLTGEVNSEARRADGQRVAAAMISPLALKMLVLWTCRS
jgi:hypothetical protein